MATLAPQGKQYYETDQGTPGVGWQLFTYDVGTTNPRSTWSDYAQTNANTNPVVFDSRGEATIFWSGSYTVTLADDLGNVKWSQDYVGADQSGLTDNFVIDQGISNAYSGFGIPTTALFAGLRVALFVSNSNTGSATFNYNGFGPTNIVLSGQFLIGGEMQQGTIALLEYDGTNFELLNSSKLSYAVTAAELAAGVTPSNLSYPELNILRYGALEGNTGAQNAVSIQSAISVLAQKIGGTLLIPSGYTFNISQVVFSTLTRFNVRCDGVLSSSATQQGTIFTDQRSSFQGTYCPLKFTNCSYFKVFGSGRINNRFADAMYFASCLYFDLSLDVIGSCTNNATPTGNSTLNPITLNLCSTFTVHNMTVDTAFQQNMNNTTDVYYQWGNNFQVTGCSDFSFDHVISGHSGYAGIYFGLNNFDFKVTGCTIEYCSGTGLQISWNAGGANSARYTIANNTIRYCQEDAFDIDNQSGTNASVMATVSGNVSIYCGFCNCSQGTTTNSSGGGSGFGTYEFIDDLTVIGNTMDEYTTTAMHVNGCVRVSLIGNIMFRSAVAGAQGISIIGSQQVLIEGNHITNGGGNALSITGTNTGITIANNNILGQVSIPSTIGTSKAIGNIINCPSAIAAYFDWIENIITITGSAQQGLVVGASGICLERNVISSAGVGINNNNQSYNVIRGNAVNVLTNSTAILITGSQGVIVEENSVSTASGAGIVFTGSCASGTMAKNKSNSTSGNSYLVTSGSTLFSQYGNMTLAGTTSIAATSYQINFP